MKINKKTVVVGVVVFLLLSLGFIIIHTIGVYSEASKYFYPTEINANDKELYRIISIANHTQEVKNFMRLYPDATFDVGLMIMCCPEEMGGPGSKYEYACLLCFPIAVSSDKFKWFVQYQTPNAGSFEEPPAVRVIISRDGEVLGIFCDLYGECDKYRSD